MSTASHPPFARPPASPLSAAALADLQRAVAEVNAGQWAAARNLAQRVLMASPADPSALNVLGTVAMNTGGADEAVDWFERALRGQPKNPFIHYNLGEAHRRAKRYAMAAGCFLRAATLKSDFAEAHCAAGDAFRLADRNADAERCYRAALQRQPTSLAAQNGYGLVLLQRGQPAEAASRFAAGCVSAPSDHPIRSTLLTNLGLAQLQTGHGLEGISALAQAVEAAPGEAESWRRLASALRNTRVAPASPGFRALIQQLFERPDINPRNLATAALAVLRQDAEIDSLLEAIRQAPGAVANTLEARAGPASRLVSDPLFRTLLVNAPIPDTAVELLLVQLRADLLSRADEPPELLVEDLHLTIAVARQAFLGEYVLFTDADEQRRVDALIASLDRSDLGARPADNVRIALVAAYRPLAALPLASHLQTLADPSLSDLMREQLAEPAEEARWRAQLPQLNPPSDPVSLAVQQQYEQNPYPRWTRCSVGEARAFHSSIRAALPELGARDVPMLDQPRVLIAGCGTGLETLRVAHTYLGASILAVDLSGTSLGYAMRKMREYGLSDIQHLQADILHLSELGESFDLIESFGVLHHMADPAGGLQILAGLLRPEGFLSIGLYSQIGRRAIVEARAHIAKSGFADDPDGVRALRRSLMLDGAPPSLAGVMSPASDFWTLSDCRDLLFHVNEHRFTLPQVGSMLQAAGLEFLGVQFGHAADQIRYRAEVRGPGALRDLRRLHDYETGHPEVFGDTYRLWARPTRRSR